MPDAAKASVRSESESSVEFGGRPIYIYICIHLSIYIHIYLYNDTLYVREAARTVVAPPSSVVKWCLWGVLVWRCEVMFLSCSRVKGALCA